MLDITALAIILRFEESDPDIPIALGIDDVEVTGSKPASFRILKPDVITLDEWEADISLHHYRYGESLEISASSPYASPDRVTTTIRRFDQPEKVAATFQLVSDGTAWRTKRPMRLTSGDFPVGLYEAELVGTKRGEISVRSVFTFMVLDKTRFESHPRFWFTEDTVDEFKRLYEDKPDFLRYIRNSAKNARERYSNELPYDLDYYPIKTWLGSFDTYQTRVISIPRGAYFNALVYTFDGDREAAEWAKPALVNLCRWPTWTHPWFRNRGHHTYLSVSNSVRELSKAYDILYHLLSPEERRIVREGLIRNGLETAYRSYVVADMVTNHESNWVVSIVGSASVAGCTIIGDVEDSSSLEPYLTGCFMKLRAHMRTVYGGDSGCIEGFGYAFNTLRMYSQYFPVFERTLGLDFNWMFKGVCEEALWAGDHENNRYFSFGDTGTSGGIFICLPWMVERFRDPALAWLLDMNPISPNPYSIHTLRFKTDDVPRERPELSGARWFKSTGTVVFRSDNGPEPFVFTFRCGPFGNHQHIDQGTFYLHDRGETLVTEIGQGPYYEDPYYQSHVIQPIGHNCILIDGNPHSQRTGDHASYAVGMHDHAHITAFVDGKSLAWATGDLSPLYLGNVDTLIRGVLWIEPRTILILDRLTTDSGEATMESLFHGHSIKDMVVCNAGFSIVSGSETLDAVVLSPASPLLSLDTNVVKLTDFTDNQIIPTGRVTVTTETRNGKAFSAVLMSSDLRLSETMQGMRGSVLARLDNGCILVNPAHEMITNDLLETDGVIAAYTNDGSLLVVEGTFGAVNKRVIIKTNSPMTVLVEKNRIVYDSPSSNTIHISTERKVRQVKLNGEIIRKIKRSADSKTVSVSVPSGYGSITYEE